MLYIFQRRKESDWMINSILKFESTWNGQAKIGSSTSQKNTNSQPHLPLLSCLQHPGGAHTSGLRIGKDGNNTAGRMISGQTQGNRWSSSWSTELALGNRSRMLQETFTIRSATPDRHPMFFWRLVAFSRPVRRNSLNATGSVNRIHFLERAQNTLSWAHTAHSVAQDKVVSASFIVHPTRAFLSWLSDDVAQRQDRSVPVAPLVTQYFTIQGLNVTSGPHKKLVSNPKCKDNTSNDPFSRCKSVQQFGYRWNWRSQNTVWLQVHNCTTKSRRKELYTWYCVCVVKPSDKKHDTNDNVTTKTQSTFHTAHMNLNTWIDARVIPCARSPVVRFWSSWFAHHIVAQVWVVRVSHVIHACSERYSSTLSSPFHPTSSSSHSLSISCSSSRTSSTTLRAVVTLRTSPRRRWTLLTNPASPQVLSPRTATSWRLMSSPGPSHSSPSNGSSRMWITVTPRSRRCFIMHTEYISITPSEKACLSVSRRRPCPNERRDPLWREQGLVVASGQELNVGNAQIRTL